MKYSKIEHRLLVYFSCFTVCSEYKKKALKMTSQLIIFRAFFRPPDPKSEKNLVNQLIKQSGLIIYDSRFVVRSSPIMADIASLYAFIHYVPIYGIKLSQITT